jgi:putative ABC transport system ATP-binding protein
MEQVSKSFKDTPVLREVSFAINKGDFVAVMGPSGSGKSTLLYSVSGMDRISDGKVWFGERELSVMDEEMLAAFRLTKMGFVFQQAQMLKNLNLFDNIILPGLVAQKEPAAIIRKRAEGLMAKMDIADIGKRDIREVSGGQLQRASICRAMINLPQILFLDEPTGALNSAAADQVMGIVEELNREGMTIMTVTHDPRVAARARRVIYIRDGSIAGSKVFKPGAEREKELTAWLGGL